MQPDEEELEEEELDEEELELLDEELDEGLQFPLLMDIAERFKHIGSELLLFVEQSFVSAVLPHLKVSLFGHDDAPLMQVPGMIVFAVSHFPISTCLVDVFKQIGSDWLFCVVHSGIVPLLQAKFFVVSTHFDAPFSHTASGESVAYENKQ